MAERGFVSVRVIAVHVGCGRCHEQLRIEHNQPDSFTQHVLRPVAAWWESHYEPELLGVEVVADGVQRMWEPT